MKDFGLLIERFSVWHFGSTVLVAALITCGFLNVATANAFDWTPYREKSVVEIITLDEDGTRRETKIWIVVLDDTGFIRTNDSRWLANIRRDPAVHLRLREVEAPVTAEIVDDPATYERVEQAFKDKYGPMQRFMSAFRMSRPSVMRITSRAVE